MNFDRPRWKDNWEQTQEHYKQWWGQEGPVLTLSGLPPLGEPMISPDMFQEFVLPPLQRQCAWLDHSLFHLDGPNCICHLEHLLTIPELDAVQWTPGAGQPGTGNDKWYDLYERILNAGKSAQILGASVKEAKRILDTFGSKGLYLSVDVNSETEADDIVAVVESMR